MPHPKATPAEIAKQLVLLEATVSRLAACAKGRSNAQLAAPPDSKTWSVAQILAHLRGCADLWTHSIYAMLAEDEPKLPLIGGRDWAKVARYASLPFDKSFQAFALQRGELLDVLQNLKFDAWSRSAIIGVNRHTVFSQARRLALHELDHCNQVVSLIKKAK